MRLLIPLLRKCVPPTAHPPSPESRTKRVLHLMFGKYLLLTNTCSSGLLMVAGDFVAQHIERKKLPAAPTAEPKGVDLVRIGQMFLVGAVQGPVQHYFYAWLDRRFVAITPATVAKKILLDQTIMSPVCIVTFFATASMVEYQSIEEFREELTSKFMTVYISDWMIWPFAQYINFTFVPAKYRVMYVNALTMLYNVWLSMVKHNDLDLGQRIRDWFAGSSSYSAVQEEHQKSSTTHLPSGSSDDPSSKVKPSK